MQVEYKLKLGQDEFTIKAEAKTQAEFFQKMSFFSSIPKVGPNGETDLKLLHRTPQGYNYYSLVSEKAGMEYKFGQSKENLGDLFGKGWEPLYTKDGASTNTGTTAASPIGAAPIGQPIQQAAVNTAAPIGVAPTPTSTVPTAAAPATPPPTNPAQVQSVANDVLARFGIKQG